MSDNSISPYAGMSQLPEHSADYWRQKYEATRASHRRLAKAVSDLIDWLDDGNRILSDSCRADVEHARSALASMPKEIA